MTRAAGLAIVGLALFAAPANATYTMSVSGTTATLTGDAGFNTLEIRARASTGRLHHNVVDAAFTTDEDFDSTIGGVQALPNNAASVVNVNGGTGFDAFGAISVNIGGSARIDAELNFDGGPGADGALALATDNAPDTATVSGGSIAGVAGVPIDYTSVDGAVLSLLGGDDRLVVASSPTEGAVRVIAGDGNDTFVPGEGTNTGARFEGGLGTDTLDYSSWSTPVTVGTPATAAFKATLSGDNLVPPVATAATGTGSLLFTDLGNPAQPFDYLVSTQGIPQAEATSAHIQAAPPGANGPVIFFINGGFVDSGGNNLTNSGSGTDPDIREPLLRDGNTYWNVRTIGHPAGLIRGQIVFDPERGYGQPATATLAGSAGGVTGIENFIGGAGVDVIHGNPLANTITGGRGSDRLFGEDGDDILHANDNQPDIAIDCGGGGGDVANRDLEGVDPAAIVFGCETVNTLDPPPDPPTTDPPTTDPSGPTGGGSSEDSAGTVDKTGVVTAIAPTVTGKKRLKLRTGSAASCPPGATAACTLTALASGRFPNSAISDKVTISLGSQSNPLAVGQSSGAVKFKVSKKLSRAWRESGKVKVTISIQLAVPDGNAAAQSLTQKLKAPTR